MLEGRAMTTPPLLYVSMSELAQAMGEAPGPVGRRKVTRWLQREDRGTGTILVRMGRKWFTTAERLRQAFPDVWRRFLSHE